MSNQNISIDVIIPCYNCSKYIAAAIDSVLSQTHIPDAIIVVDDASTDGTDKVLDKYADKIKVIRHVINKGVSAARNTGMVNSSSDLIAFLDADDVWESNKLELQARQFISNPEIGLSFTSLIDCDTNLKPIATPRRANRRISEDVFNELYGCPFGIPLSTVMIKREAIDRCGGFDESLKGVEDYDLWLRITMLYSISSVEEPLCFRRHHSAGISANYLQGEKLMLEFGAIERCARFANKIGRALPMSVEERKNYSVRRRLNLAIQWNDLESARYYFSKMNELNIVKLKDRLLLMYCHIKQLIRNGN